jgi:nicotinate-nucleotide pyrophosphorylase (carboxylating)
MQNLKDLIKIALDEDIQKGDITSESIIPQTKKAKAIIKAKEDFILCGIDVANLVFKTKDASIIFKKERNDGDQIKEGEVIATIEGDAITLLSCERIALNFLQHLSGIATKTKTYTQLLKGTKTQLLDTRKTIPGYRALEKYAVKVGGGTNHRMGLYDQILIKENHIIVAGSIQKCVEAVEEKVKNKSIKIEVECETIAEVKEALTTETDIIMLDNMSTNEMKTAVELVQKHNEESKKKVSTEASGGINLENIQHIAETGVDFISIGSALTLSAKAVDIAMEIVFE